MENVDGRGERRLWQRLQREIPAVLCISLLLAVVVKTFLLQVFYIPSPSMTPHLLINDRVLVSKLSYISDGPQPGDVIVFDSPLVEHVEEPIPQKIARNLKEIVGLQHPHLHLIKRVVAVEGDSVEFRDGRLLVNGIPRAEPYLAEGSWIEDMAAQEVPRAHLWVMGDNRNHSKDSRWFGPISTDWVIGKVVLRLWPVTR